MAPQTLAQLQRSAPAPALAGTWKLAAGRAATLEPRESGRVRVVHGQLWATFDGPHRGALDDLGDHILGAGQQLPLRRGQRLVVEAFSAGSSACFTWEPLPQQACGARVGWLRRALADLRQAWIRRARGGRRAVACLAVGPH